MSETYFDSSDFDKKFKKIVEKTVPDLVVKGMSQAMFNLMRDCVMEPPTVPIKEGWLRGAASIFVQNKLIGTSPYGRPGFAVKDLFEPVNFTNFVGMIAFNTPYAARLHEGVGYKFTEPSAGPKYLESKLAGKGKKYMQTVADVIRGGAQ